MKSTFFQQWDTSITFVTILGTILLLAVISYFAYNAFINDNLKYLYLPSAIILTVCLLFAICMTPRKVVVENDGVNVHLIGWRIHIPQEEILSVEHYPNGIESNRIIGMGLFYGNVGLFSSHQCGQYFSLVTNPSDVCVIVRKTKMPMVISIKDYNIFTSICEIKEMK